jgi:hypothetical protein
MTIALRVLSRFVVISVSRREPGCEIAEAKCRHLQLVLDPICLILRLSKSSSTGIPVICRGYPVMPTQNGTSSAGALGSSIALASLFSVVGAPRNCTRDAMISVRCRLPPSFFASNSRVRRRPST